MAAMAWSSSWLEVLRSGSCSGGGWRQLVVEVCSPVIPTPSGALDPQVLLYGEELRRKHCLDQVLKTLAIREALALANDLYITAIWCPSPDDPEIFGASSRLGIRIIRSDASDIERGKKDVRSLRRRSFCTGGHGEMEDGGVEFLLDVIGRFPLREEFADNLEHPDPVPLVLLPNSGAGLAVPADSNTGSVCAQQLGGDGNDMAGVGVRRRADASPTRLTQSTDRVNPEAPGRTKRCEPKSSRCWSVTKKSPYTPESYGWAVSHQMTMDSKVMGYRVDWLKKFMFPVHFMDCWSLYILDTDKKIVMVLDPKETNLSDEMKIKHGPLARKFQQKLCTLFSDMFGAGLVETTGWEDSGVYVAHYVLEFTGLYLRSTITQGQIEHLRKKIAYEIVIMKGN
ncbi:hypothetical protein TRIUR3_24149 [Triticum urartu]|uniref:Ubiquitin-like protease family profile domain-containing protein n=1 Tax=Triticum urartu TaxID=4572 RepID=M7ZN30_TRIUA|nr:hypothetical protein TRIUR3_24149 [Triticum urartu]